MERTTFSCYLSKTNLLSYHSFSNHLSNNKMSDPFDEDPALFSERCDLPSGLHTLKYSISQTSLRKTHVGESVSPQKKVHCQISFYGQT